MYMYCTFIAKTANFAQNMVANIRLKSFLNLIFKITNDLESVLYLL